ncbi:MAG: glycine cleavage system protein R [Spirochaetota bacterium]
MDYSYAVVRAIGKDRIGIVEALTTVIESSGCNIEESKMAVLGGEFAVMILVSGQPAALDELASNNFSKPELSRLNIDVLPTTGFPSTRGGVPYRIETVSLDSPGIVHAVTALLASEHINIEELETDSTPAPFTGSPMFTMRIRIILESPKRAASLREKLAQLGIDRDLDITFSSLAAE